ncbi:component of SufBCD complex [Tabrizicola sp.]|uniref:component of SufBCD complex n=1 Tax=Tabrizicola sp. TaxID=2005166 RepID=UPI002636AF43|nr:component of SufBCD complex [Tabrizicola sp.]MDM7930997.1 component of SufBCD complex [Tabrizicola sp.]
MDLFDTVFEVIDMRSFSNLWYWIALAVLWSSTSHWVLGVPHDMIQRGRREGGQAQTDVEDLVRINSGRLLTMVDRGAPVIVGLACFWLSALAVLGFYYKIEFAQAVFMLLGPMSVVVWLSVRTCRRIAAGENLGEPLYRRLLVHRRWTQSIGMVAVFVTAMYGMWTNVNISILN